MSSSAKRAPRILCTGIIVLDEVFRVDEFPQPDGKVQAREFFVVNGGCAANARTQGTDDRLRRAGINVTVGRIV